jgi:hypothetical protein
LEKYVLSRLNLYITEKQSTIINNYILIHFNNIGLDLNLKNISVAWDKFIQEEVKLNEVT